MSAWHEIQAHSQDPGRPINWKLWAEHENICNLLRAVLMASSRVLLEMSNTAALGQIRQGKIIFHWNVNLDDAVEAACLGKTVEELQTISYSLLAHSPILLELSSAAELNFKPDMVVVFALVHYGPMSTAKLKLNKPEPTLLYFEMVYDREYTKQIEPGLTMIPKVRLSPLGPLNRCHSCRSELKPGEAKRCSLCKVAHYCNEGCAKTHYAVSHKNTCAKLVELCTPLVKAGCFTDKF